LHPAFDDLNLFGWLINSELQGKPQDIHEPILITRTGIILGGFAEWHTAICAGQPDIDCTEFDLNADEALRLILTLHRPRAARNDFIRIELALEQEPYFQSKALANQIAGGKYKGLANLPEAQHIDVREKIADLAGVLPRTMTRPLVKRTSSRSCAITFHLLPVGPRREGVMNLVRMSASVSSFLFIIKRQLKDSSLFWDLASDAR
jgi:hypothetical protein